nr:hypothetical protein CFP56_18575 [Quercus suber]
MVEQPRPTTYKEALQKHNSFSDDQVFYSDEDDCLCERCSCIIARVFGKVAVGIKSPQSDTGFGPIVEPKKVESVFSRVEKPKQLRTFKPPIGEPNKWYSMESVSVKPPQKRHFKYGYNPYFPKMTRTQRRRWLRQQMYNSQEPRQTLENSNDALLNKAKGIKFEIQQKGGILTPKYVKTSPGSIRLIGNETSIINSIIPFEEIKENKFLEELGDADMMEGLEDIEGWDDLEAFNEFGEELELEQKKENSSNMECNVITLPIEFMAKQNIIEDEEHSSKGSNAQGACHILLTDEEMENLELATEAELEFLPRFDYNGKPTRVEMAKEQPCSAGEDFTDQEIGKEWFDNYIVEPQMLNIVEKPVKFKLFSGYPNYSNETQSSLFRMEWSFLASFLNYLSGLLRINDEIEDVFILYAPAPGIMRNHSHDTVQASIEMNNFKIMDNLREHPPEF